MLWPAVCLLLATACGGAQGNMDGAVVHANHGSAAPSAAARTATSRGESDAAGSTDQAKSVSADATSTAARERMSEASSAQDASDGQRTAAGSDRGDAGPTTQTDDASSASASTPPAPAMVTPLADPAFTQGPFTGSAACAMCHDSIVDASNQDVSIVAAWTSTMMANATRDPLWRAKVESEIERNPEHAEIVEDKCTRCHAPMAHVLSRSDDSTLTLTHGGVDAASPYYAAAQDGVSCTLCHQIQDRDLGAAASFDGHFQIGDERAIFGPYQDPFTMPMQRMVDYTPQYGAQIARSELCATCHNVKTPIIDERGEVISDDPEQGFAEQAPYTEWKNSAFAQNQSCADCHMGRTDGVIISNRPPFLDTLRDRFALHGFAGANKLMLGMLDQHRDELGVRALEFTNIQARTDAMLAGAAKLELASSTWTDEALEVSVRVTSTTGHKLPTSFPSRRVVLHVQVFSDAGQVVFESGRVDDEGRVMGLDSESDRSVVEPHHDWIDSGSQAQIYESVMRDTQGAVTFTLLNGAGYIKDNRLLPRGADKVSLPMDIAVHGAAMDDSDFQAGQDIVHYRVKGLPRGNYRVKAALLYQTLGARFADDLFSAHGQTTAWFKQAYASAPYKTLQLTQLEASLP